MEKIHWFILRYYIYKIKKMCLFCFQCMNTCIFISSKLFNFGDGIDFVWNNIIHISKWKLFRMKSPGWQESIDVVTTRTTSRIRLKWFLHIILCVVRKTRQEMDIWNPCQFFFVTHVWNIYADENSIYLIESILHYKWFLMFLVGN